MKYIKNINEFFDTEDLKSKMEIPYLKGEIPFKEIVKDKNMLSYGDGLLAKLLIDCPYIGQLNYNRLSNTILNLGFHKNINFDGKDVLIYFVIEIMESSVNNRFISNTYARCVSGDYLFDKAIKKGTFGYQGLVTSLNNETLDLLVEFNNFTNNKFGIKCVPFITREYMKEFNVGRN